MNDRRPNKRRFSVAHKIAMISWLVTVVTLVIFTAVILPQQKRTFQENLSSKARGISASLQDVIAGAAVTEDYSSVVDHCRQVLQGDDSIVYIVITKNDGYSLIHEMGEAPGPAATPTERPEPQWRQQTLDGFWRPARREPVSGIDKVPIINKRVFHYSRPFDYSGIEWGWINVGLSLQSYDKSVAAVYTQTGLLALACIVFSLFVSILYARHLIQPLQALESVLQRVASGDLSARSDIRTRDEVENLSDSFNRMTESLLQRDRILESVRFAAQVFLFSSDWSAVVLPVLASLGQSSKASRVDVFSLDQGEGGRGSARHLFGWHAADAPAAPGGQELPGAVCADDRIHGMAEELEIRGLIAGRLTELHPGLPRLFEPLGVASLSVARIMVGGSLWGILSLSECASDREWTESEKDSLRAVADMLGATIARHRTREELLEAKASLERRVEERTLQLQNQMAAKEKAHAELAEAQHRLMDVSRRAGMAEVATGVLHNVGNVLNSINVSATILREGLESSEISSLVALRDLLQQHEGDLPAFLTADPRGREIPHFIVQLADRLKAEHTLLQEEQEQLTRNVGHVKEVINMQQGYGRASGYLESVAVPALVDDALRLNAVALLRNHIAVFRQYADGPPRLVDKNRVIQILVNLVQNASHALDGSDLEDKRLTVTVSYPAEDRIEVSVGDNGIGIPPENLTRIFSHGFSTREGGHGYGLHSGALAAKEMGGALSVLSDGLGKGALFTLTLPVIRPGSEEGGV